MYTFVVFCHLLAVFFFPLFRLDVSLQLRLNHESSPNQSHASHLFRYITVCG